MPDRKQLQLIRSGIELWNAWRKDHPEVPPSLSRADFRCVNLHGADLTSADLREADFAEATLVKVSLANANIAKANFSRADLSHADFSGACLDEADLRSANLRGAAFYRSKLRHATLPDADVTGAIFAMADLSGAELAFTLGLTQAQLNTASGGADTILPARLRRPASWGKPSCAVLDSGVHGYNPRKRTA